AVPGLSRQEMPLVDAPVPVLWPPEGTRDARHPRWLLVLMGKVGKAGLFPAITSNRPGDEPVSGKPQSPAGRINSQCALPRREEERAGMDTRRLTVAGRAASVERLGE